MANTIPNRQAICDTLLARAAQDKDIVVLCSDSRGSASLSRFADTFPDQFVEVGIAEQDLVSIAAGLARCGKKAFAASPACFLSTRSYEQAKVDCAYSNTNVTLIGISGGVSYGALGMSHHSAQDIAAMSALPNMRVYLPSDRFQTAKLVVIWPTSWGKPSSPRAALAASSSAWQLAQPPPSTLTASLPVSFCTDSFLPNSFIIVSSLFYNKTNCSRLNR